MSCNTVPTTTQSGPCTPCVHPFVYLFELAKKSIGPNSRDTLATVIDRLLDKGIVLTNCNICCPDCEGIYSLASVETQLKLYEALGLYQSAAVPASPLLNGTVVVNYTDVSNGEPCCSNAYAGVETWLVYAEAIGLTQSAAVPALPFSTNLGTGTFVGNFNPDLVTCCNGFTECIEDINCWILGDTVSNGAAAVDRILDKGIVEYGGIFNNCNPYQKNSELCLLLQLFNQYNINGGTRAEILDRILDKGITISCSDNGEIIFGSVETWLKYGEAVGLLPSAAVPALGETTTTTTVI